ncbi:unnamed protein product [Rotaria sp. Silwood2]|nr:unnamed protein product [Rotaria sp. Silwood2]CAF3446380.1 unnamed protein product [Rotaria sp. Silwood2]CAF4536899.1 unnamed protein product [Rotaria sp. Silwood2]CAF4720673.1 unnamed protein product [Rotaria sp. Silwood2]
MNSTSLIFMSNSLTINTESWFIPLDIVTILSTALTVGLAILILLIILIDKTCHTVPMMLITNSCLAKLICASNSLGMTILTLHNDLQQIPYPDSMCIFRGYLSYASCAVMNYSFLSQAIYRYVIVVYPNYLIFQSTQFQLFFICVTWTFGFVYPIGFISNGNITYDVDNQICQISLGLSFPMIFVALCIYIIPISLIMFVYFKLVRYVKNISNLVTPANTLIRARRELNMFRRIVILVTILVVLGIPYTTFICMSFFISPPKYHLRIACSAIYISLACVIIALLQLTPPLKTSIMKLKTGRLNKITPTVAFIIGKTNT